MPHERADPLKTTAGLRPKTPSTQCAACFYAGLNARITTSFGIVPCISVVFLETTDGQFFATQGADRISSGRGP